VAECIWMFKCVNLDRCLAGSHSCLNSTFVLFLQLDVLKSACESYLHTNNKVVEGIKARVVIRPSPHCVTYFQLSGKERQ